MTKPSRRNAVSPAESMPGNLSRGVYRQGAWHMEGYDIIGVGYEGATATRASANQSS